MALKRSQLRVTVNDRFGWVLLATILTYSVIVAFDSAQWNGLAGAVPILVTVVLVINASTPSSGIRTTALTSAGLALVVGAVGALLGHESIVQGVSELLGGLAIGVCIIATLIRMASHATVSVNTVFAVLSAYVMFGLFFTFIDSGIGHIAGQFFAQPGPHTQSDYAYLSYITLTTVGFGDLTPGTGLARSSIIFEALVGQIFLVTLVARIVSLMGTQRSPIQLSEGIELGDDQE